RLATLSGGRPPPEGTLRGLTPPAHGQWLLLGADRAQIARGLRRYRQRTDTRQLRRTARVGPHADLSQQLLRLAVLEDVHAAVLVADVDFPIHPVGRTPGVGLEVVLPEFLTAAGVQAVEIAVVVGRVAQSVMDGAGAHGPAEEVGALGV